MSALPEHILKTVFGFSAFRGQQKDVIDHVLSGGDALVLMPTGGGKSLCYQVPALCLDGITVVVSPLIALMQDQVEALRQLGVKAAAINSGQQYGDMKEAERAMMAGELDLVYVSPERLLSDGFLNSLSHCKIALFAIDEAHCVSQWGHDFRPEYRQLTALHERFPQVPRLALTATADGPTRKDIAARLDLNDGALFVAGFDRPNIRYRVSPKDNARKQLLSFIQADHMGDAGIVYCLSRRAVEDTAAWLCEQGFNALPYHAGLDREVRNANQDHFLKEEGVIMVATIAFGMGIDKPDVRFVAHMDLPKSLEAYYQETGRAGRDGLPSQAFMVYGIQDVAKIRQFTENSGASGDQKRIEHQKLDALMGYCETARCRRQVLLEYFGDSHAEPCGNCDTCLNPPELFDGTEAVQKIMSCVYRTGQMFGAGHIIDVLLGGDTDRIRKFDHASLSTYGIGKALSRPQWQSIIRQLVAQGLLIVDIAGHGGIRLGEDVRDILRGERRIELRKDPITRQPAEKKRRKTAALEIVDPEDQQLFDALRRRRLELAQAQGVPPYVIFHDSTLVEMAVARPLKRSQFAGLPGVGEAKLDRYADDFIDVIDGFQAESQNPTE